MKSKSQKHSNTNRKKKELESKIFDKKVKNYVRTLKWGKGSTQKIRVLLQEALGSPCFYCGREITLNNIQLDHKKPMLRTFDLVNGIQNPPETEFFQFNRPQNLRFICQMCNLTKGTIPEKEFKVLIDFLKKNKRLSIYVRRALHHYNTRYSEFDGLFK